MRLSTASLLLCLFVSMLFAFLLICLLLSVPLSLFICLFGCYSVPVIIFPKCLYCYFLVFHFHQSSPIIFYFILSSIYWGRIRDTEFERHGLPLPVLCMGKPFKVSTHGFVLFVLQRVTFCFCLFVCFKLSFTTTTGVDACPCLSFDII